MEKKILVENAGRLTEDRADSDALRLEGRAAPRELSKSIWQNLSEARRSTSRDEIAALTKRFLRW